MEKQKNKYAFLNDNRRYLFVVSILILVAFGYYFYYAFASVEETLVHEQAWEKQQDLSLLCGLVDKLVEADAKTRNIGYSYEDILQFAVKYIESNYNSTFAQVFDSDLTPLTPLSPGVGGGQKHNPLDYPEFVEAVKNNESGNLVYYYETDEAGGRDVYICFQWVPTDTGHMTRYLVVIGVSRFTVKESIDLKVMYGAIALIAVTTVLVFFNVMLLGQLGYIYGQRKGEKWRGEVTTQSDPHNEGTNPDVLFKGG